MSSQFLFISTSILVFIGWTAQLRHRQVRVVGGTGGDVGAAVVWAFGASAGHLKVVAVRDQSQSHVCRGKRLLPLEQLQPLLHLPLELLVLQLLLLVNTLRQERTPRLRLQEYQLWLCEVLVNCLAEHTANSYWFEVILMEVGKYNLKAPVFDHFYFTVSILTISYRHVCFFPLLYILC